MCENRYNTCFEQGSEVHLIGAADGVAQIIDSRQECPATIGHVPHHVYLPQGAIQKHPVSLTFNAQQL